MDAAEIAVMIPVISIVGGVCIAIVAIIVSGRKKDLEHKERLFAIEKGLPMPTPEIAEKRPAYSGRRAAGLVMFALGIALTIAIWAADGVESGVWGLIPLFIGVGLLVAAILDKREYEEQQRDRERTGAPPSVPLE